MNGHQVTTIMRICWRKSLCVFRFFSSACPWTITFASVFMISLARKFYDRLTERPKFYTFYEWDISHWSVKKWEKCLVKSVLVWLKGQMIIAQTTLVLSVKNFVATTCKIRRFFQWFFNVYKRTENFLWKRNIILVMS